MNVRILGKQEGGEQPVCHDDETVTMTAALAVTAVPGSSRSAAFSACAAVIVTRRILRARR